ncbi:hypothetical protein [Couchioplanes azureus]|uniref:hypothetical protein n=1 Tax=Couchioplanes caeruleus TaxID=56438 RepID=UPI00166F9F66|nr:hypothetical protein [Couchioplanes caeruleus]GGQ68360.1 hypothetical protein GCM10010166_43000 [Couchioplanes caeruleus subsp. azureus]
MRRFLTVITLLGLSLFGLMLPAPASAASTLTADVTSATVVARGSAVDVNVTVVCPAGASGYLYLSVTQRSGGGVAQGSGSTSITCTGAPQAVTVRAVAQPGGEFFRPGEAIISGALSVCGQFECQYTEINETVRVTQN